ncbi:MAG: HNH endonuclease signature motif containing protein [Bacteroidota bacterium]
MIPTNNYARDVQGKPRIRLGDRPGSYSHIYLVLAGLLLLAKPKRELGDTNHGRLQLIDNGYSITSILIDVTALDGDRAVVRPTDLVVSNFGGEYARVDVVERLELIFELWNAVRRSNDSEEKRLVSAHSAAFESGDAPELVRLARSIRRRITSDEDPLKQLLRRFGAASEAAAGAGVHREFVDAGIEEDDPRNAREATLDTVRKWRKVQMRGADAERFRREVQRTYGFTCLFTGYCLPPTSIIQTPGVDASHILPWAHHRINDVTNGICLNKLCHWAFDEGVLRLSFDASSNDYLLSIPNPVLEAGRDGQIDLSPFNPLVGPIPRHRLPSNQALWPDPAFIARFNQSFSG